jgi:hypothetical protein
VKESSVMKSHIVKVVLAATLLMSTVLVSLTTAAPADRAALQSSVPARVNSKNDAGATNLEFTPLIVLAPDDNQTPAAGPFACVDPDGHPRSTVYHCYTPANIYAAYGVDALHAEGTTGTEVSV